MAQEGNKNPDIFEPVDGAGINLALGWRRGCNISLGLGCPRLLMCPVLPHKIQRSSSSWIVLFWFKAWKWKRSHKATPTKLCHCQWWEFPPWPGSLLIQVWSRSSHLLTLLSSILLSFSPFWWWLGCVCAWGGGQSPSFSNLYVMDAASEDITGDQCRRLLPHALSPFPLCITRKNTHSDVVENLWPDRAPCGWVEKRGQCPGE